MRNVAIVGRANSFKSNYGQGIERYKYELSSRILRINDNEVTIRKSEISFPPSLPRNRTMSGATFLLGSFFSTFDGFSLVHNVDQLPLLAPFRVKQSLFVQTLYDFQATEFPNMFNIESSLIGKIKKILFVRMSKFQETYKDIFDHYIAISSLTRDDAVGRGFDPSKISVINLGIDERFINTKITREKDKKVVGYVGTFSTNKNLHFALRSFSMVDNKEIMFKIWGKNHDFKKYRDIDPNLKVDPRVKFMGFAPEERLIEIYDEFRVLVFPSLVEGFGIPILEAQARGVPVIILKKSRIPKEVRKFCIEVEDYSEMANAIDAYTNSPISDSRMKEMIQYSRSFTWNDTTLKTLKLYKKLLE